MSQIQQKRFLSNIFKIVPNDAIVSWTEQWWIWELTVAGGHLVLHWDWTLSFNYFRVHLVVFRTCMREPVSTSWFLVLSLDAVNTSTNIFNDKLLRFLSLNAQVLCLDHVSILSHRSSERNFVGIYFTLLISWSSKL